MNNKVLNSLRRERGTATFLEMGVIIASVLATACGATTLRPGGSPPPSASPPGTPSTAPITTSAPAPAQFQALVQENILRPTTHTTVRLYSSSTGLAPVVLDFPADAGEAQFAPDDRISFTDGISWLDSADLSGGARREEVNVQPRWMGAYGWSQESALAYVAFGHNSQLVIRLTSGAAATLAVPAFLGGPAPTVRFSPDGRYVLLVSTYLGFTKSGANGQSSVQVRRLDGTLAFAAAWDGQAATMPTEAVWGTDGRLYFWDPRGVNVVDLATGVARTLLPGVRWLNPTFSPDGRYIAFELRNEAVPRIRLLDTVEGTVVSDVEIAAASTPRFVSPTVLWYQRETPCPTCGYPTPVLDPLFSYDLTTHTESAVGLSGFVTDSRVLPAS